MLILYTPDYWDICDVVTIVSRSSKKASSTEGHALVESSPFYLSRIKAMHYKVKVLKQALKDKDFIMFGQIVEAEALNMHAVMLTSSPALVYWTPQTVEIIHAIYELRSSGLEVYFTIDAGPNVHVICKKIDTTYLKSYLMRISGVRSVIVNIPTVGAHII